MKKEEPANATKEPSVVLFNRLLQMNDKVFKKAIIVEKLILPILDYVYLEQCNNLKELRLMQKLWS